MPNPIAHPAASIPFTRIGLIFSALVIGSISPDFGYLVLHFSYLNSLLTPFFMNTTWGLILFDVPVALLLLWLFHTFMKWPLLSLLPESLQRRLFNHARGFTFRPLKHFALILLSLLVGSLTHVIWDSFTHESGWTVKHFTLLSTSINGVPLYTVLQNLGTVLGITLLIYWTIKWLRTAPPSNQLPWHFPRKVVTIFFALTITALAIAEGIIIYPRIVNGSSLVGHHYMMDSIIIWPVLIISLFFAAYCTAWMMVFNKNIRRVHVSNQL
jgi:hypothetical protein